MSNWDVVAAVCKIIGGNKMNEKITYEDMIDQLTLCKLLLNGIIRDTKKPEDDYTHIKRYSVQQDITKLRKELNQLSRLVKVYKD